MAQLLSWKALTFDDVHLIPQKSTIRSRRTEIDISVKLKNTDVVLRAPIIASPMDTVSGSEMAIAIQKNVGGIAIIHRYCTIETQAEIVAKVVAEGCEVGAAIGVNGDFLERADAVVAAGAKILCVDIAHGHHILMQSALAILRPRFINIHIMAGNVATLEGFNDLSDWGADSVRLGVGSGSICSTRTQTGHGYPMLQNILDVATTDRPAQIISDGGIKEFGHINKALAAGADLVMMGSMLAGTDETPGEIINTDKGAYKTYRGMASKESQIEWRGFHSSNEGVSTIIPHKGPVSAVLTDMKNAIETGLSYTGARSIKEYQEKAVFVEVSHASAIEATPHILSK